MPTKPQLKHPNRHPQEGVVIAYLHPGEVAGDFCQSLVNTISWDWQNRQHIYGGNGGGTIALQTGPRLSEARSQVVDHFLKNFPRASWLFMIDADMAWEPEMFETVLNACHKTERPIVGGLCVGGGDHRQFATMYRLEPSETGPHPMPIDLDEIPRESLVKVDATGTAFLCVHRSVFEAMMAPSPHGFGTLPDGHRNPYPWFVEGVAIGKQFGEDIAFCMRANALGFPLHVHTGARIDHIKSTKLNLSTLERWNEQVKVHVS